LHAATSDLRRDFHAPDDLFIERIAISGENPGARTAAMARETVHHAPGR
jgi:hypothetical protein